MGGPLTVFDTQDGGEAGYVGDALMDDTEPGQTRLMTYAIDLAVDVAVTRDNHKSSITSLRIAQGVLKISRKVL